MGAGQIVTRDVSLLRPTAISAARLSDSVTGAGLPGIPIAFIKWDNNEPTSTMGYTDRQGNYNVAVSSGVWYPRVGSSKGMNLAMQGYVPVGIRCNRFLPLPAISSDSRCLLKKSARCCTAPFTVTTGCPSAMSRSTRSRLRRQVLYVDLTGSDGAYCIPVIPRLWFAYIDIKRCWRQAMYCPGGFPVTPVSEGQAVEVSYTATKTTAHLRGKVVDSDGSPVPGLIMDAVGTVSDTVSYWSSLNRAGWQLRHPGSGGCVDDHRRLAWGCCTRLVRHRQPDGDRDRRARPE